MLFCERYCSLHYTATNGVCNPISPSAVHFCQSFNSTVPLFLDAVANYSSEAKPSAPLVVYQQGVQLTGHNYFLLPKNTLDSRNLVLPESFLIEIWMRLISTGEKQCMLSKTIDATEIITLCLYGTTLQFEVLLYKYDTTVAVSRTEKMFASALGYPNKISGTIATTARNWMRVVMAVGSDLADGVRTTDLSLTVNEETLATVSIQNSFFRDFSSEDGAVKFMLGAKEADGEIVGFKGALADIQIRVGPSSSVKCPCTTCSVSGMCLSPCLTAEFLTSIGSCKACDARCNQGCFRDSDCTLSSDPLCLDPLDFTTCKECKPLSFQNNGICECKPNTAFDTTSGSCLCLSNFGFYNNECVPCLNYFASAEITAKVADNFMRMTITFARDVAKGLIACWMIFTDDSLAKLGTGAMCTWQSAASLSVTFGLGYSLREEVVNLKVPNVRAQTGTCSFEATKLAIPVQFETTPPAPEAIISAPQTYSSNCEGNGPLILSGLSSKGGLGRELLFKWKIASQSGDVTTAYDSYSESYAEVTIGAGLVPEGDIQITLSVKNFFNEESSAEATIKVASTAALSLSIDGGENVSMKASEARKFIANIVAFCGDRSSRVDFQWKFEDIVPKHVSASSISSIVNRVRVNSLEIPAYSLIAGYNYTFSCTAKSQKLSGTVLLKINALSDPLVVVCDKGDGPQSASEELQVDCRKSIDPSSASDPPSAKWTWSRDGEHNSESDLKFDKSSLMLLVPENSLSPGRNYTFTLTLSKDTRMAQASIVFYILPGQSLRVISSFFPKKVSKIRPLKVINQITSSSSAAVSWSQEGQNSLNFNSLAIYPFLMIASNVLLEGAGYALHLNIVLKDVGLVSLQIKFTVNQGPVHGKFTATPSTGLSSEDYQLKSYGWEDSDGYDFPFEFSFGYTDTVTEVVFISKAGQKLTTQLFPGDYNLLSKVCDSMKSCTSLLTPVSVKKDKRRLTSADFLAKFAERSSDLQFTVSACVILLRIFEVDQEAWTYVLQQILSQLADQSSISEYDLLALVACHEELMHSLSTDENLVSVSNSLFQVLAKYPDEVYDNLFEHLMGVFSRHVAQVSSVANLWAYYEQIQKLYLESCLPEQTPYSYAGSQVNSYLRKVLASSLSQGLSVHMSNFSAEIPSSFTVEAGLSGAQIINLAFNQMRIAAFPAGVFGLSVETAGNFSDLLYSPASATSFPVNKLTTPINVTVPIFNASDSNFSCIRLTDKTHWVLDECSILNVTGTEALLQVSSFGVFTLVPAHSSYLTVNPLIAAPSAAACVIAYYPVYVLGGLVGLLLVRLALHKRKKIGVTSETLKVATPVNLVPPFSAEAFNSLEIPHNSLAVEAENQKLQTCKETISQPLPDPEGRRESNDNLYPIIDDLPFQPEVADLRASEPGPTTAEPQHSFLKGHYVFAALCLRDFRNFICLMVVLAGHLAFLGLFYNSLSDRSSDEAFGLGDLEFIGWSILCAALVSVLLSTLETFTEVKKSLARKLALNLVSGGLFCGFAVVVVVMSLEVCENEAARWGISFACNLLAEVTLLEAAVAAYRQFVLRRVMRGSKK